MVPTKVADVNFTRSLLDGPTSDVMSICGRVTKQGISSLDGDVTGLDSASGEPLVVFRGCSFSGFRGANSGVGSRDQTHLFHQLEWNPDIAFLSKDAIELHCMERTSAMPGNGIELDFERVSRYFMATAIKQVTPELYESYDESKFHLRKYVDWLRMFFTDSSITQVSDYEDIDLPFLD